MRELDQQVMYICEGCRRNDQGTCKVFLSPETKLSRKKCECGMSTHLHTRVVYLDEKIRVGQQKQKKKTRKK